MQITDTEGVQHELSDAYVPAAVSRLRSSGRGNRVIDLGESGGVPSYVQVTDEEAGRIVAEYEASTRPEAADWKLTKDGFENATREIEIGKPEDSGYVEIGFMDYGNEPVGWVEVEKIPLWVLAEYVRVYGKGTGR